MIEEARCSNDDPEQFLSMLGVHATMCFGMREAWQLMEVFAKDPVLTIRTFEAMVTICGEVPIAQYLRRVARAIQQTGIA